VPSKAFRLSSPIMFLMSAPSFASFEELMVCSTAVVPLWDDSLLVNQQNWF